MVNLNLIFGSKNYNINTVMRYHIIYKKGNEVPFYGTQWKKCPSYINDPNKLLEITTISDNDWDYKNIVTWELNDLPLTKKFIEFYKKMRDHSGRFIQWGGTENAADTKPPGYKFGFNRDIWYHYKYRLDIYKSNTVQEFLDSRVKMNELIDYLDIDPKWKLNTESIFEDVNKLNRLHEIFEVEILKGYDRVSAKELTAQQYRPIADAWEAVNYIVHMNEKTQPFKSTQDHEQINKVLSESFHYGTTLEQHYIPPGEIIKEFCDIPMVDEDYKHFTTEKKGQDLRLDFGTVGKDLYSCWSTNDIELASAERNLSQQITYNPWIGFDWETKENNLDEYNKWIKDNKIDVNVDITQAKFTPGRHILSDTCISHPHIRDPKTFYNEVIKITPILDGWCITDDNNQKVL